ncbi:MAG TPA: FUSC family protein [Solirubrobacterales bacterium]|nr:FUSC family protein [Solirubrobacterales bacterium]
MRGLRVHISDPGLFALKSAARAAIVMPAVFGFADGVIKQPDTTLFAAFGSFAVLVFADFGGPPRKRLTAYLGLATVGALLITLGTLWSQTPVAAVAGMAVVGFVVLFSGVISGYFAAARRAALLAFILSVAVPAAPSAILDRLEGWALATAVGISAVMLIWPAHPRDTLRAGAARATRALADLLDAEISGDASLHAELADAATTAVRELRHSFVSMPYRPTGPTGATEALAFLVDELDWLLPLASRGPAEAKPVTEPCRDENLEVLAATVAALRSSAETLEDRPQPPDLDRLERARETAARTLVRRIDDLQTEGEAARLGAALDPSFRMREISFGAREVAVNALVASDAAPPGPFAIDRVALVLREAVRLLREQLTPRSAWFRDSLRGAAGLGAAVLVVQLANPQHAFWVVLAALSVLRSTALGTSSTVFWALAGTAVGILIGGALVAVIGTDEAALWVVLPPAILIAAYAPRVVSFAAGQAGFTVVVLIVFNLIAPAGWQAGLIRVEDVAIGCGISLVVGILFWPRGARRLLEASLGDAYARAIEYVASTAERLVGGEEFSPAPPARETARGAAHRLDGALRQYLTETSPERAEFDSVARLVAGSAKVRLAGYSLSTLTAAPGATRPFAQCAKALAADVHELHSWYAGLADALMAERAIAPPRADPGHSGRVAECIGGVLVAGDGLALGPALNLLWASQHIDYLMRLGGRLVEPASELSSSPG